jgi:hypothetical protein
MDLGENDELREALLGPEGDDDLEFYITFPTPTALVRSLNSFPVSFPCPVQKFKAYLYCKPSR